MWAFGCGVVSSGLSPLLAGVVVAGHRACRAPGLCDQPGRQRLVSTATSTPSTSRTGRSLRVAFPAAGASTSPASGRSLSLIVGRVAGSMGALRRVVGLALAWIYSAPPLRLKQNGWWGNSAVAVCL